MTSTTDSDCQLHVVVVAGALVPVVYAVGGSSRSRCTVQSYRHRLIGRYRRSKHSRSMTSLKHGTSYAVCLFPV